MNQKVSDNIPLDNQEFTAEDDKDFEEAFEDDDAKPLATVTKKEQVVKEDGKEDGKEDESENLDEGGTVKPQPGDEDETLSEEDLWKDVPPVVKDTLEAIQKKTGETEQQVNTQYGRLLKKLETKPVVDDSSTVKKPDKKTVVEALQDGAKFKKLQEDFSEYAGTLVEAMEIVNAEMNVEMDDIRAELKTLKEQSGQPVTEKFLTDAITPETLPLYSMDVDWQETTDSDKFKDHLCKGGPSRETFDAYKESQKAAYLALRDDPDNAPGLSQTTENMLNDMIKNHPAWWSEKGSLYCSAETKDAVKLLASYQKSISTSTSTRKKKQADDNQQQLEDSLLPDTQTQRTSHADSEEEDFLEGYGEKK